MTRNVAAVFAGVPAEANDQKGLSRDAIQGNLAEIEMGKLAQQRSYEESVKRLGGCSSTISAPPTNVRLCMSSCRLTSRGSEVLSGMRIPELTGKASCHFRVPRPPGAQPASATTGRARSCWSTLESALSQVPRGLTVLRVSPEGRAKRQSK